MDLHSPTRNSIITDPTAILASFKNLLTTNPPTPPYDPALHPDDLLLRFLKARKFDLPKAHLMFSNYLSWRVSFHVEDGIVQGLRYPEYDQVMQIYPRFYHKTDKHGRAVYFEVLSNLSAKLLDGSITTPDRFIQYYVREYEKTIRYRMKALSLKAGTVVDKSCTILDLKHVPVMQFNSVRKVLGTVTHIAQNYYPETLGKMFIINAPVLFQGVWAVVKNMLDEQTVAKISILGANYQKELVEVIGEENLPQEYGGKCTCADKGGCRRSDTGPWNDGTVEGYPIAFWEEINIVKKEGDAPGVTVVGQTLG
ncbi:cytosolic factor, phosphatidylinositol/phosphatidylcholine transfer protein [Podochytrium sp. JEL0797]|nr:cytosolic factor, phosphatidylinositol/phosphatidylcholine transfer protein [Podochytrium sp. JEL0797]